MVGFAVEVVQWDEEGEQKHRTAIVSLDTDGDKPVLDVRFTNGEDILNVEPEAARYVMDGIGDQLADWKFAKGREERDAA